MCTAVAKEDTYREVERMLYKMSWTFCKRYGGEFEEYMGAANEGFVDAYETYNPKETASFSTWVYWAVLGRLTRLISIHKHHTKFTTAIDLTLFQEKTGFDLRHILFEVSEDAKQLIDILWDFDVVNSNLSNEMISCIKSGLVCKLKETGWTTARILDTFSEIKEALQC
jgi:hypothetical protein